MATASVARASSHAPLGWLVTSDEPAHERFRDRRVLLAELQNLFCAIGSSEALLGKQQIQRTFGTRARAGEERHFQTAVGFVEKRAQRQRHLVVERQESRQTRVSRGCGQCATPGS